MLVMLVLLRWRKSRWRSRVDWCRREHHCERRRKTLGSTSRLHDRCVCIGLSAFGGRHSRRGARQNNLLSYNIVTRGIIRMFPFPRRLHRRRVHLWTVFGMMTVASGSRRRRCGRCTTPSASSCGRWRGLRPARPWRWWRYVMIGIRCMTMINSR